MHDLKQHMISVNLRRRLLLTQNTMLYKKITKNREELKEAEAMHKRQLDESKGNLEKKFSAKNKLSLSDIMKLNMEKEKALKTR